MQKMSPVTLIACLALSVLSAMMVVISCDLSIICARRAWKMCKKRELTHTPKNKLMKLRSN
ncbi:unnamed protein product [Prunus brigantina]